MGCSFCATGTMGLLGDLSAGEILEQVLLAQAHLAQEGEAQAQLAQAGEGQVQQAQAQVAEANTLRHGSGREIGAQAESAESDSGRDRAEADGSRERGPQAGSSEACHDACAHARRQRGGGESGEGERDASGLRLFEEDTASSSHSTHSSQSSHNRHSCHSSHSNHSSHNHHSQPSSIRNIVFMVRTSTRAAAHVGALTISWQHLHSCFLLATANPGVPHHPLGLPLCFSPKRSKGSHPHIAWVSPIAPHQKEAKILANERGTHPLIPWVFAFASHQGMLWVGTGETHPSSRGFLPWFGVSEQGMGEPLNNYDAVRQAVATLVAPHGFRLSPNHITISTVRAPALESP